MKTLAIGVASAAAAFTAAVSTASAQGSSGYALTVINNCNRLIYVARRVRDPGGFWITRAWMVIRPGARARRNMRTRNRVFYLYAMSSDGRLTWSGQNRQGSVRRPIVQRAFEHTTGPLSGPRMRFVSFAKKQIRQGNSSYQQTYICTQQRRRPAPPPGGGGGAEGEGGGQGRGGMPPGGREGGGRDPGGGGTGLPELGPNQN